MNANLLFLTALVKLQFLTTNANSMYASVTYIYQLSHDCKCKDLTAILLMSKQSFPLLAVRTGMNHPLMREPSTG